jgi:hypothetical protein
MKSKKIIRPSRPIFIMYKTRDGRKRVTLKTADKVTRASTLTRARECANKRVLRDEYARADIYDRFGVLKWSVMKYPQIGYACVAAREPLSMYHEDLPSRKSNEFLGFAMH